MWKTIQFKFERYVNFDSSKRKEEKINKPDGLRDM